MNKKAKFFCEYCNTEVKGNAKFCPKCGKFFASTKCPQCSKSGPYSMFINGCPVCGYAMNQTMPEIKTEKKVVTQDKLPSYVYLILMILLIGVFALILIRL